MLIGKKLKELRAIKNLTLTTLAQKSGVQMATLSRIENCKMVGSLESHMNIARALGIDITDLYKNLSNDEENSSDKVPKNLADIFSHSSQSSFEILTKNVLRKKMMPALLRIEPRGKSNPEQNQPGSEKFIFILEGEIEVHVGKELFKLKKNNTLYFDGALTHSFVNKGSGIARVICVSTPVSL